MNEIRSKNLYDLLGNDPEQDPDREPEPPTKVADRPVQRSGKRNAGGEAPAGGNERPAGSGRGARGENYNRGDGAGVTNNRSEQRADGLRGDRNARGSREPREHRGGGERGDRRGRGERGERGRGRGGRGYNDRYPRTDRGDRGNHSGIGDQEKQAAHGWGEMKDGNAEYNDELAGDAMAKAETENEPGFTPDASERDPAFASGPGAPGEIAREDAAAAEPEPEDKTKSYDQYLAEQAEKRLALGGGAPAPRKANEGSKQKFPEGNAFSRNPEDENFMAASNQKARREKTQQAKNLLSLDGQYYAPAESGDRGGRGGRGRGGRGGRGEFRGDRGGRGFGRGRGEGRGGFRGGDRDGARGGDRGGFNATDSNLFPALGGS